MTAQARRIVLHVGLPKTGSTALQVWAGANRAALRARGVDYPEMCSPPGVPNHHAILRQAVFDNRFERLEQTISGSPGPMLLLSSEGLTNHLYDFPSQALARFRAVLKPHEVVVLLFLREAEAWTRSLHAQAVLNPRNAYPENATALRLEEFRNRPRVRRLLDHATLMKDIASAFAPQKLAVFHHEDGWLGPLLSELGTTALDGLSQPIRIHESLPDDVVEFMRQVNDMRIEGGLRIAFQALLQVTVQSSNTILVAAARRFEARGLPARRLMPALDALNATTPGEIDLKERLRQDLLANLAAKKASHKE